MIEFDANLSAFALKAAIEFKRAILVAARAASDEVRIKGKAAVGAELGSRASNLFTVDFYPNREYNAAAVARSRWLRASTSGKSVNRAGPHGRYADILAGHARGTVIRPFNSGVDRVFIPAPGAAKDLTDRRLRPGYLKRLRDEGRLVIKPSRGDGRALYERTGRGANRRDKYLGVYKPQVVRTARVTGLDPAIEAWPATFTRVFSAKARTAA